MSYDLIVRGFSKVPLDQLKQTFRRLPWWEVEGDSEGVLLTDSSTGVYLTLAPHDRKTAQLSFAVNFNRPRFFALETILTVAMLAEQHGWNVHDPQRRAALRFTGEDIEAILGSWQIANDAIRHSTNSKSPLPRSEAMRVWRWNYERPLIEAKLAEENREIHLPRILFVRGKGAAQAQTMSLWLRDVAALALPPADYLVYREHREDTGEIIDRAALLEAAAYYLTTLEVTGEVPVLKAPRFSLLLSSLEKAKRGPFPGEVLASDMLVET